MNRLKVSSSLKEPGDGFMHCKVSFKKVKFSPMEPYYIYIYQQLAILLLGTWTHGLGGTRILVTRPF